MQIRGASMQDIVILPDLNNWRNKIDGICWRISKLTSGQNVTLGMEKVTFIRPQGTIMLLMICNMIYDKTRNTVRLENLRPDIQAYLERVDFFEFPFAYTESKIPWWKSFSRSVNSSTIVEITAIRNPIDSANFKGRINNIIENWFPDRRSYSSEVSTAVTEICNNSLEHSRGHESMGECFCLLQKYNHLDRPEIAIAIGDIGVGIRHHLQYRYDGLYDSDVACIKKVLDGLSGRLDGSGGMGIPFIRKTVHNYGGYFTIRSGRGVVEVYDYIKDYEFQNSFPGTQSLLILN